MMIECMRIAVAPVTEKLAPFKTALRRNCRLVLFILVSLFYAAKYCATFYFENHYSNRVLEPFPSSSGGKYRSGTSYDGITIMADTGGVCDGNSISGGGMITH